MGDETGAAPASARPAEAVTADTQPRRAGPAHLGPRPGLLLPDYGGACVDGLADALMAPPGERPEWLPSALAQAPRVVLLVLDGLGWEQLHERRHLVPQLAGMGASPITTVAPTTTATALTSLALGVPPAAHGVMGYKFAVSGPTGPEVLNVLRWTTASGDARAFANPVQVQPHLAFGGRPIPVVSRADFVGSGFTQAHQRGARDIPWVVPSSLPLLVERALSDGESFVYAYYDGIDKVAHAAGFGPLYDAELVATERMVIDVLSQLPPGVVLAVTADHGQVQVGPRARPVAQEVTGLTELISGEARFRWLHSRAGAAGDLLQTTQAIYGEQAWVAPRDEAVASGVFGGVPRREVIGRLGDVLMVPLGEDAYLDPRDGGDARLICRHGGLSASELLVPLLTQPA